MSLLMEPEICTKMLKSEWVTSGISGEWDPVSEDDRKSERATSGIFIPPLTESLEQVMPLHLATPW